MSKYARFDWTVNGWYTSTDIYLSFWQKELVHLGDVRDRWNLCLEILTIVLLIALVPSTHAIGDLDISDALGTTSMENSISRFGGKPDKPLGNTSGQ